MSVSVSPSSAKIAKSSDGATLVPFSIPSVVTLTVTVTFDDASTKDFSSDSRTAYEVVKDGSETMVEMGSGNTFTVQSTAVITTESADVRVFVSFP